jgi:hypothetical protein
VVPDASLSSPIPAERSSEVTALQSAQANIETKLDRLTEHFSSFLGSINKSSSDGAAGASVQ